MSRRKIATAKFGWFWSNDVEQTPPNALRSAALPTFDTPVQRRRVSGNEMGGGSGRGDAEGGRGHRRVHVVTVRNDAARGMAARPVDGRAPTVMGDGHGASDAAGSPTPQRPKARGGGGGVHFGMNVVEQSTPDRQATNGLMSRQMQAVPQSPFLLYAELELSPITPAGGSSALHAARSLGPLYPKSPAPSAVKSSGISGSMGHNGTHASVPEGHHQTMTTPPLVISSALHHTPGTVLNHRDRGDGYVHVTHCHHIH